MKNGFTIIELMMTVAIVAIVLAIGVPNFIEIIRDNRLASQTNILLSSLNFARSEAVKLGNSNVTVCRSTNQTSCNSGGLGEWETGWIIFRDDNGSGTFEAGEDLLRVQEPLSSGNTLRTVGFLDPHTLMFNSRGMLTATGTFVLCDSRGASKARGVVLNISGQARSAVDENADGIVNIHRTNNALAGNVTCP